MKKNERSKRTSQIVADNNLTCAKESRHPLDVAARTVADRPRQDQPQAPPFAELPFVRLVAIPPESWHLLHFPDYQRRQTAHRVRDIARGIRAGYYPAPIILYKAGLSYRIVDGGHRYLAFRRVFEEEGHAPPIPALIYDGDAFGNEPACDQHRIFVNENNKLRMDPTAIVRADHSRQVSRYLRALSEPGFPFADPPEAWECRRPLDVADYPVRPLSIVKAALLLAVPEGEEIDHNRLAYLSVNRALDELEAICTRDESFWARAVRPFLACEIGLWGWKGRHLVNFAVTGFALFLAKNRRHFFTKEGELVIKSTRSRVFEKRRSKEYEVADNSDFAKLAALKKEWERIGSRIWQEAPRDPMVVAGQINDWFWKNRPKSVRVWRPELTW